MIVDVDGKQYKVEFQHGVTHNLHHYEGRGIRYTHCYIWPLDAVGGEGVGRRAHCGPDDVFVKEIGRKLALKRALHALWPGQPGREQRRQVWAAYFDRFWVPPYRAEELALPAKAT